ncbi:MAG TPA: hypothetical protein VFF79_07235 [Conexibacter sp.]|jgi:hypothetical protein|nr:hypothetical protein [Conexibacter sp.]
MASAAASARAARRAPARARTGARGLEPGELAWIAALPCALLTLAAIVLLGPVLGQLFLMPHPHELWPTVEAIPQPEEHGRFLVGLIGPPLLAAAVLAHAHARAPRRPALRPTTIRALVLAGQLVLIAFVVICFAAQNNVVFSADFIFWPHRMYFKWPTLVVALTLPAVVLVVLRGRELTTAFLRAVRETRARRIVCFAAAALYTAIWLTTSIDLDSSIGNTIGAVAGHILWTMAEPFAVLDGRTPLVDYHAQYGQLWAYLAAAPMGLLGATIGSYTLAMATGTGLAMLAVYGIFRRLVGSSLVAFALYVPFLATAFFMIVGPPSDRYGPENIFILWPIRYGGPVLLAWLAARQLDGAAPRRAWIVFAVAGLVVVNNPDFGLAAALATFVAFAAVARRGRRALGRLAAESVAGAAGGIALFSLFTLVRSGSLPHFGLLLEFSRLYGIDGWEQLPMPELGLHLVVFLTFAVTLVVAAVRVARGSDDGPLLTGMLAWIGVFGLIASVYYAGRAHPMALFDFFAPWAFAVVLLLLVVVPALAARAWRRPTLPEIAVLVAFGLVVCSLPQTPTPWSQLARIRDRTALPVFEQLPAVQLVAATTRPGEKVGILTTLGHRVAYDAKVVNVSPYSSIESIVTAGQLERTVAALRREGASKLYLPLALTRPEALAELQADGYVAQRYDTTRKFLLMLDDSAAERG